MNNLKMKIKFAGVLLMDDINLHSNWFQHILLGLFEGECDEHNELIMPLRVTDSYSFYSHLSPSSSLSDPINYACKKLGFFKVHGGFGKFRREYIHDLAYGRGLSGQLFKLSDAQ